MPSLFLILIVGLYLLVLIFGTHFIRTVSFNRYEAVTFECSATALLLSLLLILRYGFSWQRGVFAATMLAGFVGNAFSQFHFYEKLQKIIKNAFDEKATKLNNANDQNKVDAINKTLRDMASRAIMPSFSRFIEESKLFNNPGSFIGLVKSIMKRQRFQKKKYLMRECFADNVNLIGPCKPMIGKMMHDQTEDTVAGALHANDLALKYRDEMIGLALFDTLGFGALAAIWVLLVRSQAGLSAAAADSGLVPAVWLGVLLVAFTALSHVLRYIAFARYESFFYELCFSALVAVSFGFFEKLMSGVPLPLPAWIGFACVLVFFLASSIINKSTDSALHKSLNALFSKIIYMIPPDHPTNRAKRKFLQNLKIICEWAIVPSQSKSSLSRILRKVKLFKDAKVAEEQKKLDEMIRILKDLLLKIAPGWDKTVPAEEMGIIVDAIEKKAPKKVAATHSIMTVVGLLSLAAALICIWAGIL